MEEEVTIKLKLHVRNDRILSQDITVDAHLTVHLFSAFFYEKG